MRDVVIIGGGPAGLCAGLYAARSGMDAVLIEAKFSGGQVGTTNLVENYPGFEHGIGGPELAMLMEQQAVGAGLSIEFESCTKLELEGDVKRVHLTSGEVVDAYAVILAMGAYPRKLGAKGEEEFRARGVSFCATCDGFIFKGKRVAVIGGGNTAAEDALYLANICESVTLVHRRNSLRAENALVTKLLTNPRITVMWDSVVDSFEGEAKLETMNVRNIKTNETTPVPVEGAFVAVGAVPNSDIVKGILELDESGSIKAGEDTRASITRVYAAGDIRTKPLRQIVTAVADGAVAAAAALQDIGLRVHNEPPRQICGFVGDPGAVQLVGNTV
ncbi:MAG: thioredoxin-disulfide reductase [Oscillospiraceae bacterium]|jgi:thioredoxin reductase (NADPH)|nr:thioredoxin-disulfide reductase [Oscillospiraceae bacterium]